MGPSEIKTAILVLVCVAFGMIAASAKDYMRNNHEEQMARIEVVRLQQAAEIRFPEQITPSVKVPHAVMQKVLKKNVGGPE